MYFLLYLLSQCLVFCAIVITYRKLYLSFSITLRISQFYVSSFSNTYFCCLILATPLSSCNRSTFIFLLLLLCIHKIQIPSTFARILTDKSYSIIWTDSAFPRISNSFNLDSKFRRVLCYTFLSIPR